MIRIIEIKLPLEGDINQLKKKAAKILKIKPSDITELILRRKSVDARKKDNVHFICTVDCKIKQDENKIIKLAANSKVTKANWQQLDIVKVKAKPELRPIIVGSGPAGYFAALTMCSAGLDPIVIERGAEVSERTKAVNQLKQYGKLNEQTNIQFGEGGAGTFSDGKLNTGIKDIRINHVLQTFVNIGADKSILYMAKPHIGTDILEKVIANMRHEIESNGGEVRFGHKLIGINTQNGILESILVESPQGEYELQTDKLILAIGHSARDTFEMLYNSGVHFEQKAFSMGVRIEHHQSMIDKAQYGNFAGHKSLGAADYKLAVRLPDGRGAYTFCMCPGGEVVPAASEPGMVVTNGMSRFARDGVNANSALLIDVRTSDFKSQHPLAGVELQRKYERLAYVAGGENYNAPVQLVGDFLQGRDSQKIGSVIPSYLPGVTPTDLRKCLPAFVSEGIYTALPMLDKKLHGFASPDAIMTAIESRSSSPVRILRDSSLQCNIIGIYPCGEGAGYAGGITSAAVDGIKCAEAIIAQINES